MYGANEISNARRRAIERTSGNDPDDVISKDARKPMAQLKPCNSGSARKSKKPRWLRIVTKNLVLLVVSMSSLEMIRRVVLLSSRGGGNDVENLGGSITELENFVNSVVKTMKVQLNAIDRKVEESIGLMRKEFDEKMEETELKLMGLDARSNVFENFINEFKKKSLLTMEEFDDFFEEFNKARRRKKNRGGVNGDEEVSLDEIMDYTRGIVVNEIERHAADGLGMVDYALASGGGRVVEHSEPYEGSSGGWLKSRNGIWAGAERMIRPSFGEPGHCFPLKGGSGFVVIALRNAIVPKAVTLEHVAKSVAYDRSSAPKQCWVSGWLSGEDSTVVKVGSRKFALTEFTYDLEKSNTQTYKVVELAASSLVDTIRLDFTSNYGSPLTCIYRLRIHGHEPDFVPMQGR